MTAEMDKKKDDDCNPTGDVLFLLTCYHNRQDQTVCFRLGNEGLEVCVNGNFHKNLQILRISFDKGIKLLDQAMVISPEWHIA